MTDADRLQKIVADKQSSPSQQVIYLEGKTDAQVFFALIGVVRPRDDIHQDVYVVGLDKGSGGSEVSARIECATRNNISDVFGIVDGDGQDLAALAARWDPPFAGPLFSWKAYCIENLLAKAAWPGTWGSAPDWAVVLGQYAPYTGLNRVHLGLRTALETLGLARFRNPQTGAPLIVDADVKMALAADKHLIAGRDVEAEFDTQVGTVRAAIAESLDEGHAYVNGKWFTRHQAVSVTGRAEDQCRDEWCEAARAAGGLAEVRDLWQRITGKAP